MEQKSKGSPIVHSKLKTIFLNGTEEQGSPRAVHSKLKTIFLNGTEQG